MSSRYFQCICGKMATIDMFRLTMGNELVIECRCGRSLSPKDVGMFGFTLSMAEYAWQRYMKQQVQNLESAMA